MIRSNRRSIVKVGLIGTGRMGKILAGHIAHSGATAELAAVSDPNVSAAAEVAGIFNVPQIFSDPKELLGFGGIDAVVIASPTGTHVELIQAAAENGKHIFTEKPLALTVEACDRAIAAVENAGVRLMVGFMRRFDTAYIEAKSKIDAGALGDPVMIKLVGRDPGRTSVDYARRENSGGLIADMAIHDFDLARWLMGSEVMRTQSEGGLLVYPELAEAGDIDNAVVNLKFANGAVGNVDVSRNAVYGYDVRTEVIGSEGSVFIGGLQKTMIWTMKQNRIYHDTIPGFEERFGAAYAAEIETFIDCVVEDRPVPINGRDGRAATAIAVAATRSLDEGRVVSLAEIKGG